MNFVDKSKRVRAVVIIKFNDNVHFSFDNEAVRTQVQGMYRDSDSNILKGVGEIVEIETGVRTVAAFTLIFKGYLRQSVEGKLIIPNEINARDYDKYEPKKAYVLSFFYETLERT